MSKATATYKFTENQIDVLRKLKANFFLFPIGASQVRACEKLRDMGLAESELKPASRDYVRGLMEFKRAFRLTKQGVKVQKQFVE